MLINTRQASMPAGFFCCRNRIQSSLILFGRSSQNDQKQAAVQRLKRNSYIACILSGILYILKINGILIYCYMIDNNAHYYYGMVFASGQLMINFSAHRDFGLFSGNV